MSPSKKCGVDIPGDAEVALPRVTPLLPDEGGATKAKGTSGEALSALLDCLLREGMWALGEEGVCREGAGKHCTGVAMGPPCSCVSP